MNPEAPTPFDDKDEHEIAYKVTRTKAGDAMSMALDGVACYPKALITLALFEDQEGKEGLSLAAGGQNEEAMVDLLAATLYNSPGLATIVLKALRAIEQKVRGTVAQQQEPMPPATPTGPPATAANRPGFYI